MQEAILEQICKTQNLFSESQKISYLKSLQPIARELWKSFQVNHVQANYTTPEAQIVYMLRYFPPYSQLLPSTLSKVPSVQINKEHISTVFFGAGPGPEIYGLIQYLSQMHFSIRSVSSYLYDIATNEWQFSRSINFDYLIPEKFPGIQLYRSCLPIDLRKSYSIKGILLQDKNPLNSAEIVVFQNCLNELGNDSHNNAVYSVEMLLDNMKPGSLLVLIDRAGYGHILELIKTIVSRLKNIGNVLVNETWDFNARPLSGKMPKIIRESLFFGVSSKFPEHNGLILANTLKIHSVVIQRY